MLWLVIGIPFAWWAWDWKVALGSLLLILATSELF